MKSAGKNFMTRKAQQAAEKAAKNLIQENYDLIRCEAFKQNRDDMARQTVSILLCALAAHGYGKKRLSDVYEWFLEILNYPEFFGKKLTTEATEKKCAEMGIDLSRIHVEVEMIDNEVKETA